MLINALEILATVLVYGILFVTLMIIIAFVYAIYQGIIEHWRNK